MNDQEALFDIPEQPDNNTRRYKLEWLKQNRIHDREDRAVGANAEGKGEDGSNRES